MAGGEKSGGTGANISDGPVASIPNVWDRLLIYAEDRGGFFVYLGTVQAKKKIYCLPLAG
jgi:hypothetical protein